METQISNTKTLLVNRFYHEFFNKNHNGEKIYLNRTIFLTVVGLLITLWSVASLINR